MLRFAIAVIFASFLAHTGARAQDAESGFYQVSGVATDDALNIRAEPSAGAKIVGTLAPGARPVEVLEVTVERGSAWGRVLGEDDDGWVAMRFLAPYEPEKFAGTDVPVGMQCLGTEPFWSLALKSGDTVEFSSSDTEPTMLAVTKGVAAVARNHRFFFIAEDSGRRLTVSIGRNETCSDGMSGRDYGWRIDLLTEGIGDSPVAAYEGCCMLTASQ